MKVYALSEKGDDWHVIGIYSTRSKAEDAKAKGTWDPPSTISEWDLDATAEYLKHIACGDRACARCNPRIRSKKKAPRS